MAAVLALWGAETRVKRMRREAAEKQQRAAEERRKAREEAVLEAERNKKSPWHPGGKRSTRKELTPLRLRQSASVDDYHAMLRTRRQRAAEKNRKLTDDVFFDERRRRKTVEIINLEDGFPEPTEAPPVPEWVAKHKAEMIRKAQTQKANSLTLVDSMGRRRVVPANNKAKDPSYIRIKHRPKKSAFALAENEVLVPKRHFRARQVEEDRDKWKSLFALHHYLSHMGDILRRRKSRGGPIHLRKRSKRSQHARNKAVRTAAGLGQGGASSSSSDSEADDEAYSKLAVLTANDNYLHGLYETLYRACPVFTIRRDRFVIALRSFVMGFRDETETDIVTRDAEFATVVRLAGKVASAFGVGPDLEMDWRVVLCSLRMVAFPRATALQHLRWFFLVFASGGVLTLPGTVPKLPQQERMAEYERKVAAAKRKAIAKEMELQKLYLEQVHVKPKHVPFPEMTLSERLPRPTTKYPNVQASSMMAHPYFPNPEEDERRKQLPFKQRMKLFQDDLFNDTALSGVSLLQRLKDKPGGLFYRKHVTMRAFDDMLMRDPLGKMLTPWPRECDEDASSAFETLYHPLLREYIAEMRKLERVSEVVRRAAQRWHHVKLVMVMDKWTFNTKARRLCRWRLARVNELCRKSMKAKGLLRWRWLIVADAAATCLQSFRRGVVGRRFAREHRRQMLASVLLNSQFRRYLGLCWMARTQERRRKAATDIQRSWRGRLGRIEGRRALAKYYRRELAKVRIEQRRHERRVKNMAACAIQSIVRGVQGRAKATKRREQVEAEKAMEQEIHDWHREEERKERLDAEKTRLAEKAEEERKERAKADKRQAQRVNALAMRRKIQRSREAIKAKRAATTAKAKEKLAAIKAKYKALQAEVKAGVHKRLHYLIQMTFNADMNTVWKSYNSGAHTYDNVQVVDPDKLTNEEKKRQKKLFTQINKGAKRLQADVKSSTGMTMGADAARLDTFKAVIMNEINAEMESVKQHKAAEMELFEDWRKRMRATDEREAEGIMGGYKRQAAIMMQRAWRHYRGWKGLLRLVRESYVRHFDEETGTYWYENTRTGTTQWEKPKLLKNQHVEVFVKPPTPPEPSVVEEEEAPAPLTYTQFWMQQAANVPASTHDEHSHGYTDDQSHAYTDEHSHAYTGDEHSHAYLEDHSHAYTGDEHSHAYTDHSHDYSTGHYHTNGEEHADHGHQHHYALEDGYHT